MILCWQWLEFAKAVTVTQADGGAREASAVNISYILNSFQIGYDRRVRPNYGGIPVTVGVTLYILSIGDLSEKDMDFTFDMYFRQFWTDPRLSFDPVDFGINQLVVGSEYISLIWVPDTFFVNEKIALFHSVINAHQIIVIQRDSLSSTTTKHSPHLLHHKYFDF